MAEHTAARELLESAAGRLPAAMPDRPLMGRRAAAPPAEAGADDERGAVERRRHG
jgi:hypothetical protein